MPVPDYDTTTKEMEKGNNNNNDDVALRSTKPASGVRVSIGTYQELRPEPTKLDFLPKRHSMSPAGTKHSDGAIKNQLQTELNQTLSRARLRQRLPSSDLPLDDPAPPQAKSSTAEVTVVQQPINSKEQITIERNRPSQAPPPPPPPVMSTFGVRQPSVEIQAKMASLAAASEATISQSADNKVTIKVQPFVSRSEFGKT